MVLWSSSSPHSLCPSTLLRGPIVHPGQMDAHLVLDRTEETGLLLRCFTALVKYGENLAPLVSICAIKWGLEAPSDRGWKSWGRRTQDRA